MISKGIPKESASEFIVNLMADKTLEITLKYSKKFVYIVFEAPPTFVEKIIKSDDLFNTEKNVNTFFNYNVLKSHDLKIREIFNGEILVGGGIKNIQDIKEYKLNNFSGALIGTALHDGSIKIEELQNILRS